MPGTSSASSRDRLPSMSSRTRAADWCCAIWPSAAKPSAQPPSGSCLHHAVLVASPNDGTPLATPTRWQDTVGWLANLLEHFPDNPLTFAASFVAEAIVWLAQRAAGGIPGLAAMDSAGTMIGVLQDAPGPAAKAYSALVANFSTEGGWRIDQPTTGVPLIPSDRIGCYGPGGNFARTAESIHHLNFFGRAE